MSTLRRARVAAIAVAVAMVIGTPPAGAAKRPKPTPTPAAVEGYDIAAPQCGQSYPKGQTFGIVGANNGITYSTNPCLASEWSWALASTGTSGAPAASLYFNTANPGPQLSSHWPSGATSPKVCDGSWSVDCAYDYGWYAAADTYQRVVATIGTAAASGAWWADVETANSWSSTALDTNRASIQGYLDYLRAQQVREVGIYASPGEWATITGGSSPASTANDAFRTTPNWRAGAGTAGDAPTKCSATITGGPVRYVQYAAGSFDGDHFCG